MSGEILILDIRKRQPPGWHRRPCAVPDCRKAEAHGSTRLCKQHHDVLLTAIVARLGVTPSRVSINQGGYVHLAGLRPDGKTVTEHKLVMERVLGRALLPGENVHHRNGNRPENLESWVTSQPSGQRPTDLVAHAQEILARYDSDDLDRQETA